MPSFHPNAQQAVFLDIGEWALNTNLARGTGRSTVMAIVAVKMAIQGARVHLFDPSLVLTQGSGHSTHRHFAHTVVAVARAYFDDYEFKISQVHNTLRCLGLKRPRVSSPVVDPEPERVTFDDDGSEENT